jgi:hypothetical protein
MDRGAELLVLLDVAATDGPDLRSQKELLQRGKAPCDAQRGVRVRPVLRVLAPGQELCRRLSEARRYRHDALGRNGYLARGKFRPLILLELFSGSPV